MNQYLIHLYMHSNTNTLIRCIHSSCIGSQVYSLKHFSATC